MLHQQTPIVPPHTTQAAVEPTTKIYMPPAPLTDPRQISRAMAPPGIPPFPGLQPPIRLDITQPPPSIAFMNQHTSPRPPNLIDPRQQKHALQIQSPYIPQSPMVQIQSPVSMYNPNLPSMPISNQQPFHPV